MGMIFGNRYSNPPKAVQKLPLTNHLFAVMGSSFFCLSRSASQFPCISDGERGLWEEPTLEPLGSATRLKKNENILKFKDLCPHKVDIPISMPKKMKPHTSFNVVGGII